MKITISGDTNKLRLADGESILYVPAVAGTVVIQSGDETLKVVAIYSPRIANTGCWIIGVQPAHDGCSIPDWPIKFGNSPCRFSPELTVDAPENAAVRITSDKGEITDFR